MSLLAELKQRKVFRVAAAYAVVAWLLLQVASLVLPALNLPAWTVTFTTVLLLIGFPLALVLAWSFEVVPDRGAKVAPAGARSVVVLPFANLSDDSALGHFADGLVEDLLTRLQGIPELKVASRQSSYAYKGRNVDVRTIARDLGCRYVVEGSVRRIDDRVRVTVQLIDAVEDQHLWAERYDHTLTDAFALQDEIRDAVVTAISRRLLGEGEAVATSIGHRPRESHEDGKDGTPRSPSRPVGRPGRWWTGFALVAAVVLAGLLTWSLQARERERWAREEAIPKIEALIAEEDYGAALELVHQAARVIPNDPRLNELEQQCSAPVRFDTDPSGAEVYYRPYDGTDDDWHLVGRTPLEDVPMAIGVGQWRFEHPERGTTLRVFGNPGVELGSLRDPVMLEFFKDVSTTIPLPEVAAVPPGMVLVQATRWPIPQVDSQAIDLPAFYIDRFEVTNREFREFVTAGGYREATYWQDLPFGDGVAGWQEAVARFVDPTGRPGPSTWELGMHPDNEADHPVSGLSWFEAMAYARFRGKELPTASHWYRAAMSLNLHIDTVAASVARHGNFGGRATVPVGSSGATGPYGTDDMAGNVREWLWSAIGNGRMVAGGAWNEPIYAYQSTSYLDPWDRSPGNGMRAMRTVAGGPTLAALRAPLMENAPFDFDSLRPVDDAGYAVLESQLRYTPWKPDARATPIESGNPSWTHERVTLPTGYDSATFDVQIFLPTGSKPPHQVVVLLPHSGYMTSPLPSAEFDPAATNLPIDFLLRSGRALVVIAFEGMFERRWPPERFRSTTSLDRYRLRLAHHRQEIGRTLDYLAARDDLEAAKVGVLAISYGAITMIPLLALEPRLGPAVLIGGGVSPIGDPPAADEPFSFLPRVTQPILMLSGRSDLIYSQGSQEAMLRLLGTPDDRKQRVLFDAGHGWLPQGQFIRQTLDWFDLHLGPTS